MAITAAKLVADVVVTGAEGAKATLLSVGDSAKSTGGVFAGAMGGLALAAGAAAIGIGAASVKMAGDFQSGMTSLVTGAGESQANIKKVSDGILSLATQTGTSTKQLTDGMYMIESAGFHGAAGLDVLRAAAEGAKVGNADLGTVANAVTSVMHDYASSNYTATQATNALITTVASGKTHMQDIANSLSTVLPLASSLHIPFEQVAGAMATMTNAGMSAQRASQNLAFAIRALNVESSKGATALGTIGLTAAQVHDSLVNQGLPAALQMIEDHIGKKWPLSSMQGQQALKDIMGGAAGLNVALMLSGDHMKEFEGDVSSIGDALKSKSKDVQGWANVQADFNFKMDRAKEVVETLGIKLGTALLPMVGKAVDAFSSLAVNVADAISKIDFQAIAARLKPFTDAIAHIDYKQIGAGFQAVGSVLVQVGSGIATVFHAIGVAMQSRQAIEIFKAFQDMGTYLGKIFQPVLTQLQVTWNTQLLPAFKQLLPALIPIGQFIGGVLLILLGLLIGVITGVVKALAALITGAIQAVGGIVQFVTGVIQIVSGFLQFFYDLFTGNFKHLGADLGVIWDGILNEFRGFGNIFMGIVGGVLNAIGALFSGFIDGVIGYFSHLYDVLIGHSIIPDLMNGIVTWFTGMPGRIMGAIGGLIGQLQGFWNTITGIFTTGETNVEGFLSKVAGAIDNVASALGAGRPIPGYAGGTPAGGHPGGAMIVGEEGPEMLIAPAGTTVLNASDTKRFLAGIPGYASGTNNAPDILTLITQGAQGIINSIFGSLHLSMPGNLNSIAGAIVGDIQKWALSFIKGILPKIPSGGSAGPGQAVNVPGSVADWIMAAIGLTGVPANWLNPLEVIAMHESGGDPNAVNNWDSNAAAGHPSEGLMQTIGPTFAAYMVPGHGNIFNPIDNAAAAIRYILATYGSVFNVPGIVSMAAGGAYQGYEDGTSFAPGGMGWVGERGKELMYIPRGAQIIPHDQINRTAGPAQIIVNPPAVYLDGRILASGLMPYIVDAIRYNVGTHGI